jgi:hypothetical protein
VLDGVHRAGRGGKGGSGGRIVSAVGKRISFFGEVGFDTDTVPFRSIRTALWRVTSITK